MKYNVFSYFIGEGFKNVFKNKKSTFSCLSVMCATMLIFGLFFAIGKNITHMVKEVEDSQGIQVFIKNEASEQEIKEIGEKIKKIEGVNTSQYVSKEEAYNQMKKRLENKQELLEGLDPSIFPASYMVTLTDLKLNSNIQNKINELDNIKSINSSNETINTLSKIGNGINVVTVSILIILVLISIFIISNTIKLTVYSRRKEISIMKYVGATNKFIRTPFIIEGIIIGLFAGILSIGFVSGIYNIIINKIIESSVTKTIGVSVLGFNQLFNQIVVVYIILGIGIGVIGSSISMKKYLEV